MDRRALHQAHDQPLKQQARTVRRAQESSPTPKPGGRSGCRAGIHILTIGSLLGLAILLAGLSRSRAAQALLASRDDFVSHPKEPRVRFEPGAEAYADAIARYLSVAEDSVEAAQGLPFADDFEVLVCASQESLNRRVGAPPGSPIRGTAVLGTVYMAPSAFAWEGKDTHQASLMHELAHLHLSQHIGTWATRTRVPAWFHEGWANVIAGSGGEGISEEAAERMIGEGRHVVPGARGKLWGPRIPPEWRITAPMHHRQSQMFVSYLRVTHPAAFDAFLADLQRERRFAEPFEDHFGAEPAALWEAFEASLHDAG